jgi:hypothetical protein
MTAFWDTVGVAAPVLATVLEAIEEWGRPQLRDG